MPSINRVFLAGYCEGDPKVMGERGNVVSLRMRIHEQVRKRGGGSFVKTEYVTVKGFGEVADYIGINVSDGSGIVVEGKLKTERWGPEGDRKYVTLVVAEMIQASGMSEAEELLEMGGSDHQEGSGNDDAGAGRTRGGAEDLRSGEQTLGATAGSGSERRGVEDPQRGGEQSPKEGQERARGAEATTEEGAVAGGEKLAAAGTAEFEAQHGIQPIPW